jgi:hypothetical protein
MRVAIIGTRNPALNMHQLLRTWAGILVSKGVEVSTGAADGCDTAAMEGADDVDATKLHVFLPWATYNRAKVPIGASITVYDERRHPKWTESVGKYHPGATRLTRGTFALHARNYGILMDPRPVDAVFACPQSVSNLGGTGQGMRVARGEGILLFNLLDPRDCDKAAAWIDSI